MNRLNLQAWPEPVKEVIGPIRRIEMPGQGATSEVVIVQGIHGEFVVKRAAQPPFDQWLRRESQVLAALRGSGLAVPEVYLYLEEGAGTNDTQRAGGRCGWLVMQRLPGLRVFLRGTLRHEPRVLVSGLRGATERRWNPSIWAWSPEVGRWQPEHGRPRQPVAVVLSTTDVEPHEAFDYWRHIAYYHFDADREPPCGRHNFKARAYALVMPDGALCLYDSRGVAGRRTSQQMRADGGDSFAFGMVLSGIRLHRDERDGVTVAGPGDFFCYDAIKVSQVQWDVGSLACWLTILNPFPTVNGRPWSK